MRDHLGFLGIIAAGVMLICGACIMHGCTPAQKAAVDNAVTAVVNELEANKSEVQAIAASAAKAGLKQLAKKDAANAKLTAQAISADCKSIAIPYFSGNTPATGAAAVAILNSVGSKVPATAGTILKAVLPLAGAYVTMPGADTVLTANESALIVAFLNGLAAGCDSYLAALPPAPATTP